MKKRKCIKCKRNKPICLFGTINKDLCILCNDKSNKGIKYKYDKEIFLFYRIRQKAIRLGIYFNLTIGDIIIPETCPALGIPLDSRNINYTPSIDRIDSKKGYTKGNIAIISFKANRIKNNGSIEDHENIVKYMKNAFQVE